MAELDTAVLARTTGEGAVLRQGVVTQASPLLVRVGAATTAVPATALGAYVSVVGDVVSLLEQNGDRLVLGPEGATAWQTPTLANSWVNYGGTEQAARYRRVSDRVEIEGLVKSGTLGAAVFTLPTGYRPALAMQFATATNGAFGLLTITSAGLVVVQSSSNVWAALNCSFSVT